jgi:hypothetical protein
MVNLMLLSVPQFVLLVKEFSVDNESESMGKEPVVAFAWRA